MTKKQLTNTIYDTLMKNVGMSDYHVAFPLEDVTASSVYADSGKISMHFRFGKTFKITVEEVLDAQIQAEM
jgi:hypothetical protein